MDLTEHPLHSHALLHEQNFAFRSTKILFYEITQQEWADFAPFFSDKVKLFSATRIPT